MALLYTLGGAYANFPEVVRFGCIHRRHLRRSLLNLENLATSSPSARSFCHCCPGCIVLSAGKNDCMQRLRKSLVLATGAKNSIFQISLTVSWLLIFTALGGDIHWSWKATWSRTQRETHGQQSNPGQSTCNSPAQNFYSLGFQKKRGVRCMVLLFYWSYHWAVLLGMPWFQFLLVHWLCRSGRRLLRGVRGRLASWTFQFT